MAGIDDRILALETRLKEAKAKRARAEAKKRAAERALSRQQDTRRKILIGAVVLGMTDRGEMAVDALMTMLDGHLSRDDDRALFDLPPLQQEDKSP